MIYAFANDKLISSNFLIFHPLWRHRCNSTVKAKQTTRKMQWWQ